MMTGTGYGELYKELCKGCDREFELENLYSCYHNTENLLGDVIKPKAIYIALCGKCRDETDANYKDRMEKGKVYDKHKATYKEEAARIREENTRLREENAKLRDADMNRSIDTTELAMTSVASNTIQNATLAVINDNVIKPMEAFETFVDSDVRRNEDTPSPGGELKRKHSEETNVVNNASTESKTMECISCKGTKPLSTFQTKYHRETKSGRIAERTSTRKKCKSCRRTKCNRAKKARISPGDNLRATEKEPEGGVTHQ